MGKDVSLVIPVFNEEKNVIPLYHLIKENLKKLKLNYEIIFIDDGSKDKTFQELLEVKKNNKDLILIRLRKHFGKSAALDAGLKQSKGNIIITMDGDLQDDPSDIPRFLEKINHYEGITEVKR